MNTTSIEWTEDTWKTSRNFEGEKKKCNPYDDEPKLEEVPTSAAARCAGVPTVTAISAVRTGSPVISTTPAGAPAEICSAAGKTKPRRPGWKISGR
jgi:hypothetical protein